MWNNTGEQLERQRFLDVCVCFITIFYGFRSKTRSQRSKRDLNGADFWLKRLQSQSVKFLLFTKAPPKPASWQSARTGELWPECCLILPLSAHTHTQTHTHPLVVHYCPCHPSVQSIAPLRQHAHMWWTVKKGCWKVRREERRNR